MKKLGDILTGEELELALKLAKEFADKFLLEKNNEKEQIANQIKLLTDEDKDLQNQFSTSSDYKFRQEIMDKRQANKQLIDIKNEQLKNVDNVLKAISKGGTIVEFDDKTGQTYKNVADFTKVKTDVISFNEETILIDEPPAYIPFINEERFKRRGGILDAIRLTNDTYVVSYSDFKYKTFEGQSQVFLLTLDQLVLTNLYYLTKLKATYQAEADRKTERSKESYKSIPLERRERHYAQKNFYNSIPKAVQKKYSETQWNELSLEQKEELAPAYKRYSAERFKAKLESDEMYRSFHDMYNVFINPEAQKYTKNKNTGEIKYIKIGETSIGMYASPEVWTYWEKFRDMMNYKLKDINFQREEVSENYKTAIETSFGESNTNNSLYADFGVLVKRQNGDDINQVEINQIENSLINVFKVFGGLKQEFISSSIKISHTGKKLVFAQKAVGCYISNMGTIACSEKYGELQFNSTMAHEIAHFIDNKIGIKNGKRWETDNYESTAGIIAFTFRNHMNKPKSEQSDYINATKECFARAMQQYFVMKTYGDDAEIVYGYNNFVVPEIISNQEIFVKKEIFNEKIKPFIELFLEENKDFFNEQIRIEDINKEVEETIKDIPQELSQNKNDNEQIIEAIDTLKILLDTLPSEEHKEVQEAIDILEMLNGK